MNISFKDYNLNNTNKDKLYNMRGSKNIYTYLSIFVFLIFPILFQVIF